ncbi:hypothetical protein HanIR_Chr17g0848961 [Helianthus annuus]|nr:hypothetical protein HanIR_Chr17g0848961 [Helianthus annuus]
MTCYGSFLNHLMTWRKSTTSPLNPASSYISSMPRVLQNRQLRCLSVSCSLLSSQVSTASALEQKPPLYTPVTIDHVSCFINTKITPLK